MTIFSVDNGAGHNPVRGDNERRLYVSTSHPNSFDVQFEVSGAQAYIEMVPAPPPGNRIVLTDVIYSSSGVGSFSLLQGTQTVNSPVLAKIYIGRNDSFEHSFVTSLPLDEAKALAFSSSGQIADHTVCVVGYIETVAQ